MTKPRITGLNHVTLAVSNLDRSLTFYRDLLGLQVRGLWPSGAYLEAGSLWLCLSHDQEARTVPHPDSTHVAFSAASLAEFEVLSEAIRAQAPIWKEITGKGALLFFLDPDGHRLELHLGTLATRLADWRLHPTPERTVFPAEA